MRISCKNCGGNLSYRMVTDDARCDRCGSIFSVDELKYNENELYEYTCSSCGAKLESIDETSINKCLYCGSKEFRKSYFSNSYKPIGIIPFKIDGKTFRDRILEFFNKNTIEEFSNNAQNMEIMKCYMPYSYADNFFAEKTIFTEPELNSNDKQFDKNGNYQHEFNKGNYINNLSREFLNDIVPFHIENAKKIHPIYFDNTIGINIKQEFFDDYFKTRKPEYYWVPVWFAKIMYNDEDYIVIMNGETGEISGEYGTDKVTIIYETITNDSKTDKKRKKKSILWTILLMELIFIILSIFLSINTNYEVGVEVIAGIQFIFILLYGLIVFDSYQKESELKIKITREHIKEKHYGRERFKLPPINIDREKS